MNGKFSKLKLKTISMSQKQLRDQWALFLTRKDYVIFLSNSDSLYNINSDVWLWKKHLRDQWTCGPAPVDTSAILIMMSMSIHQWILFFSRQKTVRLSRNPSEIIDQWSEISGPLFSQWFVDSLYNINSDVWLSKKPLRDQWVLFFLSDSTCS